MNTNVTHRLLCFGFLAAVLPCSLFAYGFLSQFMDSSGTTFHDPHYIGIPSTDLIVNPLWPVSSMPLRLKLCTGSGTAYSSASVKYSSSKLNELVADMDSAVSAWASVGSTGSNLSFSSTEIDATANCTDASGDRPIYFSTVADGSIVAYTTTTYTIENGSVIISDSRIDFNRSIHFVTHACNTSYDASGNCSPSNPVSGNISFQGALTHELGHFIGISHSEVNDDNSSDGLNSAATMFPSVSSLSESRALESLATDDQLAKQNLYPGSGFPNDTGGTISGYIRRGNSGQRGAHITAFDLTTHRTIAGAFSGVDGTRVDTDGAYVIKGIPLDTDFAIFVEPIQRTDVHSNLVYNAFNPVLSLALDDESEGYRTFAVEAYPDVSVADVRKTGDWNSAPGFSSAQVFRLTSSQRSIANINFFISNFFSAPNDSAGSYATLGLATYNGEPSTSFESPTISNSNPIRITLSSTADLSFLSGSSLSVTGTRSGQTSNWSGAVNNFTYSGKTSTVSIHPDNLGLSDGTYSVAVTLTHPTQGSFKAWGLITATGWTHNLVGDAAPSSGGGGCELQRKPPHSEGVSATAVGMYLSFFLMGFFTLILSRIPRRTKR